jgi:hypothetical protein
VRYIESSKPFARQQPRPTNKQVGLYAISYSKKNRTLSAELEPIVIGEAGAPVRVAWSLVAARACSSLN